MPPRKKSKKKTEAKWRIVKRAYRQIGFGENISDEALDLQCKSIASTIPREHKTEESIANYAIHIWYWNQEGCDKNSIGMDMKNAHRRLKGTLPEDSEDSEAELEDKDLEEEDEEEILEEEDFDIVEEQPKRAPRRSKRKRKRSPSPLIPDLSDNDDSLPPEHSDHGRNTKSKKRRRLRSKIQSLGGDEEDSGPPDPFADDSEEVKKKPDIDPSNSSLAIDGLDDDLFPDLDEDEDDEKQPDEPNPKPATRKEGLISPLPIKRNEEAQSNPKPKEDDDFLGSLFDTQEVDESQELLPPASASIGDTAPEGTGDVDEEEEDAEEDKNVKEEEMSPDINQPQRNWQEKVVKLRFLDIKKAAGRNVAEWEEVVVRENSIKPNTTIKRLRRKVVKHAKLRLNGYDLFLETPNGRVKMTNDDESTFAEHDTISKIRETYNINLIELTIEYSVLIAFKLYAADLPEEKNRQNDFFFRKLCFKDGCSLERIIQLFDDYEVEDLWIDNELVDPEQTRLFQKGEVPEIIIADGTIDVPGLKDYGIA